MSYDNAGWVTWYDKLYASKDYAGECDALLRILRERQANTSSLLDAACGTGRHIAHLRPHFTQVAGFDVCDEQLVHARQANPGVSFWQADMASFQLGRTFSVITCLFSAIGHLTTLRLYRNALACFCRHLEPGGWLVVEPWLQPAMWKPATTHMQTVQEPELKIARLSTSQEPVLRDGVPLSIFDMHYLIATPQGVQYIVDRLELALYTREEQLRWFEEEGFDAEWLSPGLTGRGLLVGHKR